MGLASRLARPSRAIFAKECGMVMEANPLTQSTIERFNIFPNSQCGVGARNERLARIKRVRTICRGLSARGSQRKS